MIKTIKNSASSEIEKDGFVLNKENIEKWLISKNIISENDSIITYEDISEWSRGGAETYLTIFRICYKGFKGYEEKKVVIKALVSILPDKALKAWNSRRNILLKNSLPVSNWYWFGDGIIIEDYYPFNFNDILDFSNYHYIQEKVREIGFNPNSSFVKDILFDSKYNPYIVDFGFDLGDCKI